MVSETRKNSEVSKIMWNPLVIWLIKSCPKVKSLYSKRQNKFNKIEIKEPRVHKKSNGSEIFEYACRDQPQESHLLW